MIRSNLRLMERHLKGTQHRERCCRIHDVLVNEKYIHQFMGIIVAFMGNSSQAVCGQRRLCTAHTRCCQSPTSALRKRSSSLGVLQSAMIKQVSRRIVVDVLQSHMTARWQKVAMIVGNAMRGLSNTEDSDFLEGLRELSKHPDIESLGDISQFRSIELRLRAGPSFGGTD